MNVRYMTSSELKSRAKDLLDGHFGSAMLILFLGNMVSMTLTFMITNFFNSFQFNLSLSILARILIPLLINMVIAMFTNIFSAGYALFFLNMACKRSYDISNLFYGFRWQLKKCLILSGFFSAVYMILQLPCQICSIMFLQSKNMNWLTATMLAASAAIVIRTVFLLIFSQCFYLMLDFPEYSAGQLLRSSMRLMSGHKGRLFYLQMSFIPLVLLALLSCGIGMLWLRPYMQMTCTCFFLDLMNPQKIPVESADIT